MACYYKINELEDQLPLYKGYHLQKINKFKESGPKIKYDFSKHVLIELLDESTPEKRIWSELGLTNSKSVVHKRLMIDSHRLKCRRAVVICINADEAKQLAQRLSQAKIMKRCVCAVVIQDLLSDLCLFEKQIIQYGDNRPQHQLLYVTDLNRCREPPGLIKFLKETFSPFGTILSVLICPDGDRYAHPEGVIKFAYLSEAFAAELALDQYVVGKERLTVTAHHNILLSQCDLRVRLRDAHWCNKAEPNTFSESYFNSYELNDLSTFDENSVVNSIDNLHISKKNAIFEDKIMSNNLSVSYPEDNQCHANNQCDKMSDYLSDTNCDSLVVSDKRSKLLTETNKNSIDSKAKRHLNKSNKLKKNLGNKLDDITVLRCTNVISESSMDQIGIECKLNSKSIQNYSAKKVSNNLSDCESYVSCRTHIVSKFNSPFLSPKKVLSNSIHSDRINAGTEYYSISSNSKQLSSIHNDPEINEKAVTSHSKKRRKYFTSSQKLCLKSQRVDSSQNAAQNTNPRSEISQSNSSHSEKLNSKYSTELNKEKFDIVSTKNVSYLPTEEGPSKVTTWLSYLPSLESMACADENLDMCNESVVSNLKKHKNRISIHNTPSIHYKSLWEKIVQHATRSDNSSVENDDPNQNNLLFSDGNCVLSVDKFCSPLQAWLKQELTTSVNNSVTKSQESSKSIIVCAAKTKDVIISVGCSLMTCDFCYPASTDLLLGYD